MVAAVGSKPPSGTILINKPLDKEDDKLTTAFEKLELVQFPDPADQMVNMMPIIMGDPNSIPGSLRHYADIVEQCDLKLGSTVYLSVNESIVKADKTQRRPGIHTEATSIGGWGGGSWGSSERTQGIYMASTDGSTRLWDCLAGTTSPHGAVAEPAGHSEDMAPSNLYWLGDRTPHAALPVSKSLYRQWFRLVAEPIFGWYAKHSTANPLGVLPTAPIFQHSKF